MTPASAYRNDIDGLRALAVLSVMLYHLSASIMPGGFVGVDIFFVISGFVVSASLANVATERAGHLLRFDRFVAFFYARRLARIGPALILVLLTTALLATLFVPRAWLSEFNERTGLYAFYGLSNWVLQTNVDTYFAPRAEFNPYTHTWSLGVEEQFYVVFPFLFFLWVAARRTLTRRMATASLIGLGVASLIGCIWAMKHAPTSAFYGIVFRFWELATGVALFQLTAKGSGVSAKRGLPANVAPWLGLVAIAATFAYASAAEFPWFWAVPPVVGAALLIGGVQADVAHPLRRMFAHPALVWIGKRSYSLYLWHWPVYVLLRWTSGIDQWLMQVIAIAVTFALATASYHWIELPIRHHSALQRRPPVLRVFVFLLALMAGWGVMTGLFASQPLLGLSTVSRNATDWYVTNRMPAVVGLNPLCKVDMAYRALAGGQVISYVPTGCPVAAGPEKLFAIGDSHATAYLPMFDRLSIETGIAVSVYTSAGCGLLDLKMPMTVGRPPGCIEFARAAVADVHALAKAGDVVFLASLRQWRYADQWAAFDEKAVLATARSDTAKSWAQQALAEAPEWLDPLAVSGVTILFEAPKPIFKSPTFRCADWFNAGNPICRGGIVQPSADLEALRAPMLASMRALAAANPAIKIWDPFPILCPSETCSAVVDGKPLFFDGDHLSAHGNMVLYPAFREALARR
jgi:peptidoglycan/LPS O-acetylase OafA/YrhL